MEELRRPVDELEMLVDKEMWPMPSYGDLILRCNMEEMKFLEEQQVSPELIRQAEEFRNTYTTDEAAVHRIVKPSIPFYGKDILEMAIAGLLRGENLLLTGPKATGKNILAENLAYIFGRPSYNVSFHVNTNSGDLIGTDTFSDNEVKLRKGSIYQCAEYGGFGILDEINMAKMTRYLYFMPPLITVAPLMFRGMTESISTLRPDLSEP